MVFTRSYDFCPNRWFCAPFLDEDERQEYVMNDTGRVWVGTKASNYGKPWVFGQFESCAIESAKYVLEISDLQDNALNNPVIIARTFSKMSNSFDDDGILQGSLFVLLLSGILCGLGLLSV